MSKPVRCHGVSGAGRGRGIGFPTLNGLPQEALPRGVFAAWLLPVGAPACLPAAAFFGQNSFGSQPLAEAHALSGKPPAGDFWLLPLLPLLREFIFFDSPAALAQQLKKDCAAARKKLAEQRPPSLSLFSC